MFHHSPSFHASSARCDIPTTATSSEIVSIQDETRPTARPTSHKEGEKSSRNGGVDSTSPAVSLSQQFASPPHGGLSAWLQVFAGHLIVFNTWGYVISFGIFQPHYETMLSLGAPVVSWIGSVQVCLILLVGTISGRAFDAGYYHLVLVVVCVLQLMGIFGTSVSTQYWQGFLAQGLCQGLGCGLVFAPSIANISTYFSMNRTMAISLAACGGATGGVVFPLIAQQLLTRVGFGWTIRVMGLIVLITSITLTLVSRTILPSRTSGPLVELAAFKEPAYVLFALSMFCTLWATHLAYYYVSLTPKAFSPSQQLYLTRR